MVKINGNKNVSHDSPSSGNSVASDGHFELFGSGGSDLSEDELFFDDRRTSNASGSSTVSVGKGGNFRTAMDRLESAPLLGAAPPPYRSIPVSHTPDPTNTIYKKKLENSVKLDSKKQSSLVTIFSIWNTVMGSSLLTMAWGVERAGLPAALFLVVFMAALCLYTAYVLLLVNKNHGTATCEVPSLCFTLLGPWAERVAHFFSMLVLVGANVVYWILITNFLYFSVNYLVDLASANGTAHDTALLCPTQDVVNGSLIIPQPEESSPYWGLHTTVPFYVAFLVFPLLNFSNVSFFTKFNSLGTLAVVYLVVFVLVKAAGWGVNLSPGGFPASTVPAALSGMLALSFYIHNIIITIMNNNRRQDNNSRDLTIAFVLVTLTYLLVGAVFYICFPLAKSCIQDNILNNFEIHDTMTAVARALLLFQVITVYPLVAYMLRSEALLLLPISDANKARTRLTVAINVTIVCICVAVACLCPNIGTIIRYTGAVSGLVHVFALPSILQIRSLQLRGRLTLWKLLFYFSIVLFGVVNLIMQFFV